MSLPFNLSCRMERLFNSSITRKCPPEHKRSRAKAGEAGYLEPPSPPPHLSACRICWSTEEVRRPPWRTGIGCKCFEHLNRDFKGRRVYWHFCICNSDANQNIRRTTRGFYHPRVHTDSICTCFQVVPTSRSSHLRNFQSGCRWPHLKRHTSGRVEALGCRHVCLFRLSILWV